jgi:sec-independent protein translocase protein TatC
MAYYVAMPIALKYLLGYSGDIGGVQQEALPGVGNYLTFVMKFIFGFGIAFLLPVLLMILERAGIVTRDMLRKGRRYAIVAIVAVAAVLTPPDIMSQVLLAVPLYLLYEFAIIAIWFTQRRRAADETIAEEAAAE